MKTVTACVGGLAFMPTGLKTKFYKSLQDWVAAKCPDDCFIVDTLDALNVAGLRIHDAFITNGVYHRCAIRPLPMAGIEVRLHENFYPPHFKCKADIVLNKIQHSNTLSHHKMKHKKEKKEESDDV